MFAWPAKWTVALKGGNQAAEHQVWSWPLDGRTGLLADDPSVPMPLWLRTTVRSCGRPPSSRSQERFRLTLLPVVL
jgi:hypothetical protein